MRYFWVSSFLFIISHLILHWLGLSFIIRFDFMHFMDPEWLKNDLISSLWYLHGFPPLMNAWLGLGLKLSSGYLAEGMQLCFFCLSFALFQGLIQLFRLAKFNHWLSLLLAFCFTITPAYLYFERFFFHTLPATVVLLWVVVFFLRAVRDQQKKDWRWCFVLAGILCFLRSTFHLIWVLSLIVLGLCLVWQERKKILSWGTLAVGFVLSFYLKNFLVFGFFGASSWFGNSLANQTVFQLSHSERKELIGKGELNPMSEHRIFYNMNAYRQFYDFSKKRGITCLDQEKKSIGQDNFNHWVYLASSQDFGQEAKTVLRLRPDVYWQTVQRAYIDFFKPSTRWHPADPKGSPFKPNRSILEPYENTYNQLLHQWFLAPLGWYAFLPIFLLWSLFQPAWQYWRYRKLPQGVALIALVLAVQIIYVMGVSCLVSIGELERMRFMVEPLIWVLVMMILKNLIHFLVGIKPD